MLQIRTFAVAATLAVAALLAAVPPAQADSYFGPVTVKIGCAGELPIAGASFSAPINWSETIYFVGDQGFHPTHCLVLADPYYDTSGLLLQPAILDFDAIGVYGTYYPAWVAAGHFHFSPDSPPACTALLSVGQCIRVSGRYVDTPSLFGQRWEVDSLAPISCP